MFVHRRWFGINFLHSEIWRDATRSEMVLKFIALFKHRTSIVNVFFMQDEISNTISDTPYLYVQRPIEISTMIDSSQLGLFNFSPHDRFGITRQLYYVKISKYGRPILLRRSRRFSTHHNYCRVAYMVLILYFFSLLRLSEITPSVFPINTSVKADLARQLNIY